MRQLYSTPRMQSIERLATLLNEAGIETHVGNAPSFQLGNSYQRFSYRARSNASDTWPQLWVVHSADMVRAREILRDAGLEPTTRYSDELAAARDPESRPAPATTAARMRRIILAGTAGSALVLLLRMIGWI